MTSTVTILNNWLAFGYQAEDLGGLTSHPEVIQRDMRAVEAASTDAEKVAAIQTVLSGIQWYLDEESRDWGSGETADIQKARQGLRALRVRLLGTDN